MFLLTPRNMAKHLESIKKSVILAKSSNDIYNSFSNCLNSIFKVSSRELHFRGYQCRIFYVETNSFSIYCFLINIQNSIIKRIAGTSCLLIILITYDYSLFLNPRESSNNVKRLVESVLNEVFKRFDDVEFVYNLSSEILFDRLENLLFKDELQKRVMCLLYPVKVYYYITIIEYIVSCFRDVVSSSLLKSRDLIFFLKEFNEYASTILNMRVSKIIAFLSVYVAILIFIFKILFTFVCREFHLICLVLKFCFSY